MIPDLTIRSKGGNKTDVYSGDVKLLDLYSLTITSNVGGTFIVASSCQRFVYEGPALLTVDPAYQNGMKNSPLHGTFPEDRTVDIRIQPGHTRRGTEVTFLDTGDRVDGVTSISLNAAHDTCDVVVMYVPLPERRGDQ